jgi:hypothetical protein
MRCFVVYGYKSEVVITTDRIGLAEGGREVPAVILCFPYAVQLIDY